MCGCALHGALGLRSARVAAQDPAGLRLLSPSFDMGIDARASHTVRSPPRRLGRLRPAWHALGVLGGLRWPSQRRGRKRKEPQLNPITYRDLCDSVAAGSRTPTAAERSQLSYWQLLGLQVAERMALARYSPEQRLLRARRGELTAHQRGIWCANYPEEVPMVNRVPAHIAATLCDIVDEGEAE